MQVYSGSTMLLNHKFFCVNVRLLSNYAKQIKLCTRISSIVSIEQYMYRQKEMKLFFNEEWGSPVDRISLSWQHSGELPAAMVKR